MKTNASRLGACVGEFDRHELHARFKSEDNELNEVRDVDEGYVETKVGRCHVDDRTSQTLRQSAFNAAMY